VSTASTRTRRWKRIEYEQLIDRGIFQPGERLELIGGQLVVRQPQDGAHALGVELVAEALREAFGAVARVRVQLPIALDEESEPEPDVSVVGGPLADADPTLPSRALLIVEVSDSSLALDRTEKASLYARAGIADYWILNLVERVLEVHREPDRGIDGPVRLALPPGLPPRRRRCRLTTGRAPIPDLRRPPGPLIRLSR
jgi:Uma2 family endonuclease